MLHKCLASWNPAVRNKPTHGLQRHALTACLRAHLNVRPIPVRMPYLLTCATAGLPGHRGVMRERRDSDFSLP